VTRARVAMLALVLLAFGLRAWGTTYGFPQPWARPDELRWVRIALGILEDPNPRWFEWPTLHAYLLAVVYAAWGACTLLVGRALSWHAFTNPDGYPADVVLLGRLLSAALGALQLPLVFRLGVRTGSRTVGWIAAVLLAVSFGPLRDAHWALIEPLLLLGLLATLLLTLRAIDRPTLARFALAGVAAGLTTSAKYSALTLCAPIALAVVAARRAEGRSIVGALWDARGWAAALLLIVGFFAGSPFILVSWVQFVRDMGIRSWSYRDASFGTAPGFVHHLLFSLRYGHGVLVETAGIAGLLAYGWRDFRRGTVLAYTLGTYLAIGPARIVPLRYGCSLSPGIVLGAAWLLVAAWSRWRVGLPVAAAALALLVADPLYRSVRLDMLLARKDTRVQAREWLDARLAPGTVIMIRDSKAMRWGRPALEDRYRLVNYVPRLARQRRADYALLAESGTGYIPWAPEIDAVLRANADVVATFDPFTADARPVYDPHDAFFVPVAGFSGVSAPGPRITIFRFRAGE
jgi:hypothetical protein